MKSDTNDDMELIKRQLQAQLTGERPNIRVEPIEDTKPLIKAGYAALMDKIEALAKEGMLSLDDLEEPLPVELFSIKDETLELLANPVKRGEDGIDLVGCTEQSLLALYLLAKELYDEKLLDEAACAFVLLTHIAPQVSPFWLGLGLAYEAQQDWSKACDALKEAIKVNPEDFAPFHVLIRIAASTHDIEAAKEVLENHKNVPEIQQEVETALEALPAIVREGL